MSDQINVILDKQAVRLGRALLEIDILQTQLEESRGQVKSLAEELQTLQTTGLDATQEPVEP